MSNRYTLNISCNDRPGISMQVMTFINNVGGNVLESQQFNATDTDLFFMRTRFEVEGHHSIETLSRIFVPIVKKLGMKWKIRDSEHSKKVLLFVSKFDHCLGDLLYRQRLGD